MKLFSVTLIMLLLAAALPGRAADLLRPRRILYNLDGDSCMTLKAGRSEPGPIQREDLLNLVAELTQPGSQVDTLLVCVNAQVMYYPTRVGTMRGTLSTEAERAAWSAHERQRFQNMEAFYGAGIDPYAVLLAEGRQRGLEVLLTFRMNDDHGNDFLRTAFWRDHPECRLGQGALNFTCDAVHDYVFGLIEEAVQRYDCDGIELDFNRFPRFFAPAPNSQPAAAPAQNAAKTEAEGRIDIQFRERIDKMTGLMARVRQMLDREGQKRGRRLLLAARVPSDFGRTPPSYENARELGCDPFAWAGRVGIDFLTVSEFLFTRYDLPIRPWRDVFPTMLLYGGIECAEGPKLDQCMTPERYLRAARHLWAEDVDGIYLFNFFTTREHGPDASEPPFAVLTQLAGPAAGGPWPELVDVRRIWNAAPHNAFTDLLRRNDEWFCVFREGSGHIPGTNGVIRVLRSADGQQWESAATLRETGIDLRDPKICQRPDGQLMLLMGGSTYAGNEGPTDRAFVTARTRVAFSANGRDWTAPQPVSVEGEWLWRVTWHKDVGYGFGYTFLVPAKDVKLTLWRTTNGVDYTKVVAPTVPAACWPDETTVRFRPDDTMIALVRGEQADHHAFMGLSRPPYTDWEWQDTRHAAQGPNFLILPDDRMIYAGRDYPADPKTVLGELTTNRDKPWIELKAAQAKPRLTLPSGGDTSYPGLVWHDGMLWVSYYASHEGQAAIYLARVKVPGKGAGL